MNKQTALWLAFAAFIFLFLVHLTSTVEAKPDIKVKVIALQQDATANSTHLQRVIESEIASIENSYGLIRSVSITNSQDTSVLLCFITYEAGSR